MKINIPVKKYSKESLWILFLSLTIAVLVTGWTFHQSSLQAQAQTQQHLAAEVLRFHILANSDSEEDQQLKMDVKESILSYLEEVPKAYDVEETKEWIRLHLSQINEIARNEIQEQGYDYTVSSAVTLCYFPEKTYGDVTFPPGNYEALRIEIGAGEGHNWWCVLYPNLCFIDATNAVIPEEGKEELRQVLTEEEYEDVTATSNIKIKWYFKDYLGEKE